jgi:class 3 adenylate cyclase
MEERPSTSPSPRLMVVMFTDLVGSTALKARLGHEEYRNLKRRHDQFIGQALSTSPSGTVLQDTGDGYFLTFASIGEAISTALMFQWLMAREPWPHPFKSRVGLHLGEVEEGRSEVTGRADFISSTIDIASRTMSVGLGGQILMMHAVFDAARQVVRSHPKVPTGEALPELTWMSHGYYEFKGWTEPVELFEVGLRDVAPLTRPPDSEKAKSVPDPVTDETLTRRWVLATTLVTVPLLVGAGIWFWVRKPDPFVEELTRKIKHQVDMERSHPPITASPVPSDAHVMDRVVFSDNPAFDIQADNRVLDMRGWKEVAQDKLGEYEAQMTLNRKIHVKKNKEAQYFECQARTSGLDVVISCNDAFPSTYEIQRGESFVGKQRMKVRKLNVDVSSIAVGQEFDLDVVNTYWNSMQTEDEQWFGVIGYKNSFEASMLLLFPSDKPYKSFSLTVSKTEKDTPAKYDGKRIVLEGPAHDWLFWQIPDPQSGHVYRLDWKW